jgi:biotin synthase
LVPKKIRVSIGTASVLGLVKYYLKVPPTTAYLMSFTNNGCRANCSFCAQARDYQGEKGKLSRVIWPSYELENVLKGFESPRANILERICFQVINYPGFEEDTIEIIKTLNNIGLPISLDTCPLDQDSLLELRDSGVEKISIPLDGATPEIFNMIKGKDVDGPYIWEKHLEALDQAVSIFGIGNVGSNLIIGLGETEKEAVDLISKLKEKDIDTILFAFTPVEGTRLQNYKQPDLRSYRRVQIARYLIANNISSVNNFSFNQIEEIKGYGVENLYEVLRDGKAFETSGCPGCNRPFYNERPSGPIYNYPRPLSNIEAKKELDRLGVI